MAELRFIFLSGVLGFGCFGSGSQVHSSRQQEPQTCVDVRDKAPLRVATLEAELALAKSDASMEYGFAEELVRERAGLEAALGGATFQEIRLCKQVMQAPQSPAPNAIISHAISKTLFQPFVARCAINVSCGTERATQ